MLIKCLPIYTYVLKEDKTVISVLIAWQKYVICSLSKSQSLGWTQSLMFEESSLISDLPSNKTAERTKAGSQWLKDPTHWQEGCGSEQNEHEPESLQNIQSLSGSLALRHVPVCRV